LRGGRGDACPHAGGHVCEAGAIAGDVVPRGGAGRVELVGGRRPRSAQGAQGSADGAPQVLPTPQLHVCVDRLGPDAVATKERPGRVCPAPQIINTL
jgi:hypothetical protein